MVDTNYQAHQAIRNLSTNLAMKGALPPEAARQMCDGFVSRANLLQAQQAMIDARDAGDGTSYSQAEFLHRALGVALRFQDAQATAIEGRNDALETLRAREAFGDGNVARQDRVLRREPAQDDGPGFGTGFVVGALFVNAIALMSSGSHEGCDRGAEQRGRRYERR